MENEIKIKFPDGKKKNFLKGIDGNYIAESISNSLAKKAIAIKVDGLLKDLSDEIKNNCEIKIITLDDHEGLDIMRHTLTAQVLARAVKNIYPDAKLAIGPTIENGFYYDVLFKTQITLEDLNTIEKEMRRILLEGNNIKKKLKSKNEAIGLFKKRGEDYKIAIISHSTRYSCEYLFYRSLLRSTSTKP